MSRTLASTSGSAENLNVSLRQAAARTYATPWRPPRWRSRALGRGASSTSGSRPGAPAVPPGWPTRSPPPPAPLTDLTGAGRPRLRAALGVGAFPLGDRRLRRPRASDDLPGGHPGRRQATRSRHAAPIPPALSKPASTTRALPCGPDARAQRQSTPCLSVRLSAPYARNFVHATLALVARLQGQRRYSVYLLDVPSRGIHQSVNCQLSYITANCQTEPVKPVSQFDLVVVDLLAKRVAAWDNNGKPPRF